MAIHPTHAQFRDNIEPVTGGLLGMSGMDNQYDANQDALTQEQEGRVSFYQQNEEGFSGNMIINDQATGVIAARGGEEKSEEEKRNDTFRHQMRSIQASKAILKIGEKSFGYEGIENYFTESLEADRKAYEAVEENVFVDPADVLTNDDGQPMTEEEARVDQLGGTEFQGPLLGYTQEQIYYTRGGMPVNIQAEAMSRQLWAEMERKQDILDKLESGELTEADIDPDLLQDLYENGASIEMSGEATATMDDQPAYGEQNITVSFTNAVQDLEEMGIPVTPDTPAPAASPAPFIR